MHAQSVEITSLQHGMTLDMLTTLLLAATCQAATRFGQNVQDGARSGNTQHCATSATTCVFIGQGECSKRTMSPMRALGRSMVLFQPSEHDDVYLTSPNQAASFTNEVPLPCFEAFSAAMRAQGEAEMILIIWFASLQRSHVAVRKPPQVRKKQPGHWARATSGQALKAFPRLPCSLTCPDVLDMLHVAHPWHGL